MRIVTAPHSALPFAASQPTDADLSTMLQVQVDAGLDVLTDGQPGWSDPIVPQLAGLDGVRLGAPHTLPCGIVLAARPIVVAKLRRHHAPLLAAYRRAAARTARPLKVVLTGPYTLAQAAEIASTAYRHPADLAVDLSALLALDVSALVLAGATLIQIDEPLLLAHPADAKLLRALLEPLVDAAGDAATVIVTTYGADAGTCYAQLNTLPGDVIGIDCVGHPEVIDAIAETGSGKRLALGVVDAAAVDEAALARLCDRLLTRYGHDVVGLQPARGVRDVARLTAVARAGARLR